MFEQHTYTLDPVGNVLSAVGAGGATDRVSESSTHGQGNGVTDKAFISSDGRYVTFRSGASNLVPNDTNNGDDVFVKDRLTNGIVAADSTAGGAIGNARADDGSISADGRYAAFRSQASNLVANDTNGTAWDTFVKDLQSGTVDRVSVSTSGTQANGASFYPVLSADGRWVAFRSDATNLVTGDTNGVGDIYLRDRQTNTTTRISVATGGTESNGKSDRPTISNDGRYVLYESDATNLVSGDTNAVTDMFLYDRDAATTARVSVSSSGVEGNGLSDDGAISGDGSTISFESAATNLVSGDTNAKNDVFVRTIATGATVRGSVGAAGAQGNKDSSDPSLSYDGTKLGFASTATNLVAGDTNNRSDVFVRDLVAGTNSRFSIATDATQSNDTSQDPWLSSDASTVAFQSVASNLVSGDSNNTSDVFVRGPGLDASTYTYDHLYRLTGTVGPDGSPTYSYDLVGNRTSKVLSGTTTNYTYDRADRITAAGATSITVNANGNTTAKGADTFTYDQANRLKTATVSGTTETYAYDGDGVRFSRQVGAGTPIRFVNDVNRGLPVTIDEGGHKYVYGLGLAYAVSASTIEIEHTDRLGSVGAITDAGGAVTGSYRMDEWGVTTSTSGTSSQLFGFTGEPGDATGLIYLRARYYDPTLGRFMSRDSWGGDAQTPQTLDRYTYALDNPTTLRDPSGNKAAALTDTDFDWSMYTMCGVGGQGRASSHLTCLESNLGEQMGIATFFHFYAGEYDSNLLADALTFAAMIVALHRLPPGELSVGVPPGGPVTGALAASVAAAIPGAEDTFAKHGLGYVITAPLTTSRNLVIRIMDYSGSGTNYFRITVSGAEAYDSLGRVSQLAEETHIPIGSASFDEIMYVVGLIAQGR